MRQALRTTATRTIRISGKAQYRQPCRYSLPRHFPLVKRKAGAQGKPLEETAEQRNPKYTALSGPPGMANRGQCVRTPYANFRQ